jgi:hypothetical protein
MPLFFCLVLVVRCAPPPICRGLAFLPYRWYPRLFATRYRFDRLSIYGNNAGSQPACLRFHPLGFLRQPSFQIAGLTHPIDDRHHPGPNHPKSWT